MSLNYHFKLRLNVLWKSLYAPGTPPKIQRKQAARITYLNFVFIDTLWRYKSELFSIELC